MLGIVNLISLTIHLVSVKECVRRKNVLVFFKDHVVRNIVGVTSNADTDSEDVFVLKVNVELDNVHVLQQNGNVTQMSVKIVGPGNLFFTIEFY